MYCTLCVPIVVRATYTLSSNLPVLPTRISEGSTHSFIATLNLANTFTLDTTIVLDIELLSGDPSGT